MTLQRLLLSLPVTTRDGLSDNRLFFPAKHASKLRLGRTALHVSHGQRAANCTRRVPVEPEADRVLWLYVSIPLVVGRGGSGSIRPKWPTKS